jgi:predicted enzyme related to lactoylglutathione lyase
MPKKLSAVLAFVNIPSDDIDATSAFFEKLLGIDLVPNLSDAEGYHAPISDDGIDLNVNRRHNPAEGATPYFAVRDLDAALAEAQASGGETLWGPEDLRMKQEDFAEYRKLLKEVEDVNADTPSVGRAALVRVPGGSTVGLVQLATHTHRHFAAGRFQRPLDDFRTRVHDRSRAVAERRGLRVRPRPN